MRLSRIFSYSTFFLKGWDRSSNGGPAGWRFSNRWHIQSFPWPAAHISWSKPERWRTYNMRHTNLKIIRCPFNPQSMRRHPFEKGLDLRCQLIILQRWCGSRYQLNIDLPDVIEHLFLADNTLLVYLQEAQCRPGDPRKYMNLISYWSEWYIPWTTSFRGKHK